MDELLKGGLGHDELFISISFMSKLFLLHSSQVLIAPTAAMALIR